MPERPKMPQNSHKMALLMENGHKNTKNHKKNTKIARKFRVFRAFRGCKTLKNCHAVAFSVFFAYSVD
jgi:hypothetical protein